MFGLVYSFRMIKLKSEIVGLVLLEALSVVWDPCLVLLHQFIIISFVVVISTSISSLLK